MSGRHDRGHEIFRGTHFARSRRGHGPVSRHRRPRLGNCPRLAAPADEQNGKPIRRRAPEPCKPGSCMTDVKLGTDRSRCCTRRSCARRRSAAEFLAAACGGDLDLRAEVESLLAAHRLPRRTASGGHPRRSIRRSRPAMTRLAPGQLFEQRFELLEPGRRRHGPGLARNPDHAGTPTRRAEADSAPACTTRIGARFQTRSANRSPSWNIRRSPRSSRPARRALGQPYFVMEYVAGLPITDYCAEHRLSAAERLELSSSQACEGVQHAHQKAIIHRDLKPANILILQVDGKAAAAHHRFRTGASHRAPRPDDEAAQTLLGHSSARRAT